MLHLGLYIFHSFAVRLRDSPGVSPLRFRFLFFCIRSPEAWQLFKVPVLLNRSDDFRVGRKFAFIFCGH